MLELAWVFLKLGCIAFGGPAAHIALFEEELVKRRRWLSSQEFLDILGATHLIPGPNSTEMVFHVGLRRAGLKGLLVAGLCFILPAALIVSVLAHLYKLYGALPDAQGILYGIRPVLIALVLQALWRLYPQALKSKALLPIAALVALLSGLGIPEIHLVLGAGLIFMGAGEWKHKISSVAPWIPLPLASSAWGALWGAPSLAYSPSALALFFLKVGSVLFGSGYTLIAFLRGDLVERWQWITETQLLDAVAVGQFTPGPLLTSATFIGYQLSGAWGAILATVCIFLPGLIFVILSAPHIRKIRDSARVSRFLDAVNAASWALMGVAGIFLARDALIDGPTVAIAALSAFLLIRYNWNSVFLVIAGALIGFL